MKLTLTQGVALRALNDAKEVADGGWKDHTLREHGFRVVHRRTLDALVARGLVEESRGAWDTGTETPDGRAVWMHDDHPRARFVVARPERRASGAWGLPTLVTVLPLEFAESRRSRGMKR